MSQTAPSEDSVDNRSLASAEDGRLPPVAERLGYLRPSRELLEYYRQKIADYDQEHEKLVKKLEAYKCTYVEVHKTQVEIQQREQEIAELQKALSDMQIFLLQEREHVLRLYAENDRLKIRELEDRKRIQHLLSLTKPVNSDIAYFHTEPSAKVIIGEHSKQRDNSLASKKDRDAVTVPNGRGPGGYKTPENGLVLHEDQETLFLTVEALKSQLEEQTRLGKEQVDALLDDRRVRMEEAQALHERDTERIAVKTSQLKSAQSLLYESTRDYLDLKYEYRTKERQWMGEKDQLLSQLDQCKKEIDMANGVEPLFGTSLSACTSGGTQKSGSVKQLQQQLQQVQQLAENYREQCIKMEEDNCKLNEEVKASKDIFSHRSDKMAKRLAVMNSRYEALEKRRSLEVEGYKNDITLLRLRLKDLEKQLYKLMMTLGGDQELGILSEVKKTASRSQKLMGDLQHLKAKIYSLESDLHHVHN